LAAILFLAANIFLVLVIQGTLADNFGAKIVEIGYWLDKI